MSHSLIESAYMTLTRVVYNVHTRPTANTAPHKLSPVTV